MNRHMNELREVFASIGQKCGATEEAVRQLAKVCEQYMPPDGQERVNHILIAFNKALEEAG